MDRIFHFRATSSQLGPLEERLLEALWRRGDGTVREMVDDSCQDLAYTTVMTTLDRLFKKNLLSREAEGRAFRIAPASPVSNSTARSPARRSDNYWMPAPRRRCRFPIWSRC